MKRNVLAAVFVVIAAAIIAGGAWYSQKISNDSEQSVVDQGVAAQQSQQELMSQLKITDIKVGTGAVAENGEMVTVNYTGTLDDGTKFDSSYDHGQPFTFPLGAGRVIQGWDLGVVGMKVGGTRELVIPPQLGYGNQANGPIPANATLHFTITLVSVSTSTQ